MKIESYGFRITKWGGAWHVIRNGATVSTHATKTAATEQIRRIIKSEGTQRMAAVRAATAQGRSLFVEGVARL